MEVRTGTVSQINAYVKRILDNNKILANVNVKGEISNFKRHYSGHIYLTLKDSGGVLRAVMFRNAASRLAFEPSDGMKVIANGRVSVYEAGGSYQLYIESMVPDGIGSLYEAYERLKNQLEAEGLFRAEHKKPLPAFPNRIGVVTAPTGAAVRDIINVITRRWPLAEIILYPAQVQGEGSAASVARAIKYFNGENAADVIIAGRGGGSIEDLWAFNEEIVARAIFDSHIPVISAVGHETDFTIADFVADMRAPTPSAAAEIAVPSETEMRVRLKDSYVRMANSVSASLKHKRLSLSRLKLKTPKQRIEENMLRLDALERRLEGGYNRLEADKRLCLERFSARNKNAFTAVVSSQQKRFAACVGKLDALSPLAVLSRGYAIPMDDGMVLKSAEDMTAGRDFTLKMTDGDVMCRVSEEQNGKQI